MLGDSTMALPFLDDFLHKLTVAVDIDDSSPILNPNNEHFYFDSPLYVRFFADFEMLKFEHCCLVPLHAGH